MMVKKMGEGMHLNFNSYILPAAFTAANKLHMRKLTQTHTIHIVFYWQALQSLQRQMLKNEVFIAAPIWIISQEWLRSLRWSKVHQHVTKPQFRSRCDLMSHIDPLSLALLELITQLKEHTIKVVWLFCLGKWTSKKAAQWMQHFCSHVHRGRKRCMHRISPQFLKTWKSDLDPVSKYYF